ncbi:sulfite exporter TauE/SafE family protein [Rubritepida flocculans]|jgi:uncharacterized membrane protein YfcA|uniref:sulfite exporter TauE/SafE family protein n=1 Tax=Rubritepida flocculans TaxID=182403 RepID=UPI0003F75876|nr:sulfite exporter TauE/SafE family protein [Rubritepida flocculans]
MWAEAALVSAGCLLAALCASVAGFAFVLVGAAVLLPFLSPALVAPILVTGSLIVQGIGSWAVRDAIPWPRLGLYLGAALPGLPLGLAFLALGPARWIVGFVGALLVLYAGYTLARIALGLAPAAFAGGRGADALVGFACGVLGGIGGYVGALLGMWADATAMPPRETRALMQPFIAIMQALTIPGLLLAGLFTREALLLTASAVPALLLGAWLGLRLGRALPAKGFRLLLLGLLLVSGLFLLV